MQMGYVKKEGSPDGTVYYKARLVSKGYVQREDRGALACCEALFLLYTVGTCIIV